MSCKKCKCEVCSCIVNEQVKIAVNKIVQNPDEKGVVDIKVPTKTSDLINDSGFVQGGEGNSKIENIRVNENLVPIVNKVAQIYVPTKTSDLENDSDYTTNDKLNKEVQDRISADNLKLDKPTTVGNISEYPDVVVVDSLGNSAKAGASEFGKVKSVNGMVGDVIIKNPDLQNFGNGVPIYKGEENDIHKFKTISFEGDGIDVVTNDGDNGISIKISAIPENPSMRYFYVNQMYNGLEEDGSMGKPYKTLDNAIRAYVGTGTDVKPEYMNSGVITLLSNVDYYEKIKVNNLNLNGNGYIIYYKGLNPYFIDTEYLIDIVGKDATGELNENVNFTCENCKIYLETEGAIKHMSYQKREKASAMAFLGTLEVIDFSYKKYESSFTNVLKKDGTNATMFGIDVKKLANHHTNIPVIYSTGVDISGDGSLAIEDLIIESWANTMIKFEDTSANIKNLNVKFNIYRVPYGVLLDGRIPYHQPNLFTIDFLNTWTKIDNLNCNTSYYIDERDVDGYPMSANSMEAFIRLRKNNSRISKHTGTLIVNNFYVYGNITDNFIQLSKGVDMFLGNGALGSVTSKKGLIKLVPTNTSDQQAEFHFENSTIVDLKDVDGLVYTSPFSSVNGTMYTTYRGFQNDTEAKDAGLIRNNLYYNYVTKSYAKVE